MYQVYNIILYVVQGILYGTSCSQRWIPFHLHQSVHYNLCCGFRTTVLRALFVCLSCTSACLFLFLQNSETTKKRRNKMCLFGCFVCLFVFLFARLLASAFTEAKAQNNTTRFGSFLLFRFVLFVLLVGFRCLFSFCCFCCICCVGVRCVIVGLLSVACLLLLL